MPCCRACQDADALVMAAAVADFRVKHVSDADKLKKRDGIPQIELTAAPDVLGAVAGTRQPESASKLW